MNNREHSDQAEDPETPAEAGYPLHPELAEPGEEIPGEHPQEHHGGHAAGSAIEPTHDHSVTQESHDGHSRHERQPKGHGHDGHDGGGGHDGHEGHDKHAGHSVEMFRNKFWISLLLTIPTIIWGHMLMRLTGYVPPAVPGSMWIAPVFGTAVFLYGGVVFLRGAVQELRARLPGMMTLISLAISVAFVFSAAVFLGYPGMPLWEELATLVTVMLLGHWIEMRSIFQAQGALKELAKLLPATAERIVGEGTETVAVEDLEAGQLVLIRPGASVPADGIVRHGRSAVNESMITGESQPVEKNTGDEVIGGTVNGQGALRVEVSATGDRTALAGIMRLVSQAQQSRSRAQALADRAAFYLTFVAIGAGALTAVFWIAAGAEGAFVVERVVAVLVVACPHALGLAIPLVVAISTTLGARAGLLVRDRRGLEEARNLNAVVFDKTGTLTLGEHRVTSIRTAEGYAADAALAEAAALERDSEHPVARAILASAEERGLSVGRADDFRAIPGYGVEGRLNGRKLAVGGPNLLRQQSIELTPELAGAAQEISAEGRSVIYLIENAQAVALFAIADAIRPESAEAVRRLHANGVGVVMLTGDSRAVAESVARELGIDTVLAEVLPDQKAQKIRELQEGGKSVAMVGDGVNDAPALVTADVGIAIGAGTDVAVEAGDVVLVRSDPRDVARIIELSKASYRKMVQNLWWAAGYNIIAIPLAAGVLASYGILLAPAVAAVFMSASTVIVAINAQLLRRAAI